MKLIRNVQNGGIGKYLVINVTKLDQVPTSIEELITQIKLHPESVHLNAREGNREECFVIKLKDQYARAALVAYAESAYRDDPEYSEEVRSLACRAGLFSPWCKRPD